MESRVTQFGRYELLAKIGEGGFGEVFAAFDPDLRRRVAIKSCTSDDSGHLERFAQEAAISASLEHRNLTATYDFFSDSDTAYMVQEFLDGEDLDRKISRQEHLSSTSKFNYLIQLARGLAHAHQKGVIHGDVKPSNVRILPNGQVKLMDFGIARSLDGPNAAAKPNETMGTAAYLSPEQIRGESIDQRSDIYSFGVTAYELLTYERPFAGKGTNEILDAVLNRSETRIEELWPECSPLLAQLIHTCLQKDPGQRHGSFLEVLKLFDVILGGDSVERKSETRLEFRSQSMSQSQARELARSEPTGEFGVASESTRFASVGVSSSPITPLETPFFDNRRPTLVQFILGLIVFALLGALAANWFRALETDAAPRENLVVDSPPATSSAAPVLIATASPPSSSPATGTLVLPASWNRSTTARVGDQTFTLDEQRSVVLPEGRHPVTFQIEDDPTTGWNESQSDRRSVLISEGQSTRVVPRLPMPGAVTIRTELGAPNVFLRLDGEPLGWAPINSQALPPGLYEVLATNGPDQTSPNQIFSLRINSGEEVVVSFDIAAGAQEAGHSPRASFKEWIP